LAKSVLKMYSDWEAIGREEVNHDS